MMAHEIGITNDDLRAQELKHNANAKNCMAHYHDGVVAITDVSGVTADVHIIDGRYCIKSNKYDMWFDEPKDVMQQVLKDES